jgi:6-phosphogluconolactonase
MSYHLYVSNAGSEWLSHFIMDEQTGTLAQQENINLDGSPGAVATNAAQTLMVVALRSSKQLGSYSIDQASGRLTRIGGTSLEGGPTYLRLDNTDRYLLASYYSSGHVSVHGFGQDGSISEQPLQWIETAGHAHSIQTDRSNRFAFVPHTNPANAIYQFMFDENTGRLTANEPSFIQPETEEGPRHFIFHPHKDILYSINENGSTVSAHTFDPDKGTLCSFQVISTLPDGYDGADNTTAEIDMTPDGRSLFASNRGHDSLALFEVAEDGRLSANGHVSTEATPRFIAVDPTGQFVYSAGQKSGRMASYKIDAATSALEPLAIYDVGQSPLWIQFVKQS